MVAMNTHNASCPRCAHRSLQFTSFAKSVGILALTYKADAIAITAASNPGRPALARHRLFIVSTGSPTVSKIICIECCLSCTQQSMPYSMHMDWVVGLLISMMPSTTAGRRVRVLRLHPLHPEMPRSERGMNGVNRRPSQKTSEGWR